MSKMCVPNYTLMFHRQIFLFVIIAKVVKLSNIPHMLIGLFSRQKKFTEKLASPIITYLG